MRILVDSSVLLDVFTQDPQWARWSEEKLALHAERDLLAINAIIYAEVSVHFSTQEELEQVLSPRDFQRLPLPYDAAFLAAKCFLDYRRRGGQKRAPLPEAGAAARFLHRRACRDGETGVAYSRFSYLLPFSTANHSWPR